MREIIEWLLYIGQILDVLPLAFTSFTSFTCSYLQFYLQFWALWRWLRGRTGSRIMDCLIKRFLHHESTGDSRSRTHFLTHDEGDKRLSLCYPCYVYTEEGWGASLQYLSLNQSQWEQIMRQRILQRVHLANQKDLFRNAIVSVIIWQGTAWGKHLYPAH